MLCAERLPQQCHRSLISDYLMANKIPVIHILEKDQHIPHRLSDLVRYAKGQLIYDRGSSDQFAWEF